MDLFTQSAIVSHLDFSSSSSFLFFFSFFFKKMLFSPMPPSQLHRDVFGPSFNDI